MVAAIGLIFLFENTFMTELKTVDIFAPVHEARIFTT